MCGYSRCSRCKLRSFRVAGGALFVWLFQAFADAFDLGGFAQHFDEDVCGAFAITALGPVDAAEHGVVAAFKGYCNEVVAIVGCKR